MHDVTLCTQLLSNVCVLKYLIGQLVRIPWKSILESSRIPQTTDAANLAVALYYIIIGCK